MLLLEIGVQDAQIKQAIKELAAITITFHQTIPMTVVVAVTTITAEETTSDSMVEVILPLQIRGVEGEYNN